MNPKPDCQPIAGFLVDYSDGELATGETQLVREHLRVCSACRSQLARLDASLATLQKPFSPLRPIRLVTRRQAHIAAAAMAAIAAGLVIVAVWLDSNRTDDATNQRPVVQSPMLPEKATPTLIAASDAFRQIALLEQQARLETSHELIPAGDWNAAERIETETILEKLRQATAGRGDTL
jgi:anti-sigma factor RsiW